MPIHKVKAFQNSDLHARNILTSSKVTESTYVFQIPPQLSAWNFEMYLAGFNSILDQLVEVSREFRIGEKFKCIINKQIFDSKVDAVD